MIRDSEGNGTVVYRVSVDIEQGGAEAAGDVGLGRGGQLLDMLLKTVALVVCVVVAVLRGFIDNVVRDVVVGGETVSTEDTFVNQFRQFLMEVFPRGNTRQIF